MSRLSSADGMSVWLRRSLLSHAAAANSRHSSAGLARCSRCSLSLGRMSRTNEIVSMLTAGVSIPRLLVPLIVMGVADGDRERRAELLARAARGTDARKRYFDDVAERIGDRGAALPQPRENRTWFIQVSARSGTSSQRPGAAAGRERQHREELLCRCGDLLRTRTQAWELRGVKVVSYDDARQHHRRRTRRVADDSRLERNAVPSRQREHAR